MSELIEINTHVAHEIEKKSVAKHTSEKTITKMKKHDTFKDIVDKEISMQEPMLIPETNRYTLFPIKHDDIWKAYKNHEAAGWTAEELDYSADKEQWEQRTPEEKYFIEHILAFFAGADGIVLENLMSNFSKEVQWMEARLFYGFQGYIEGVHSHVYSLLIDTYINDPIRKDELFRAIETIPCVALKANWAIKWMDPLKATFAERLVAFLVVEGVFFSGSFCSIFWLKSRGIMVSGLGKSNELIARDEGLHAEMGALLYNHLDHKLSKERIHEIFKEAVEIETQFITESIPCDLIGMNAKLMNKYVKFISNFWMSKLITSTGRKCSKLYKGVENPFTFMDSMGLDGKTNFFEQRVTEYRKSNTVEKNSETFNNLNDDDF